MKQTTLRLLALLLCLSMLASMVYATQTTDPTESSGETTETTEVGTEDATEDPTEDATEETTGETTEEATEPTEPDYEYPDDWSRPALVFAVENGIFHGDEKHQLNPTHHITRAEMAAVLVRLLGAAGSFDLSVFHDVDLTAWYCRELAAAVDAGIFTGTSTTEMSPNDPITREQTMVVLCRAFGIVNADRNAYTEFSDGAMIMDYARDSVSALRRLGLVRGYEDGTLLPQNPITRAEVAQLLRNLFDVIADVPEELPAEGRVLYRGTESLPAELELDGTLILGRAMPTQLAPVNWNITDSLILRTEVGLNADLNGVKAGQLVLATAGDATADCDEVWLWGNGMNYKGNADRLYSFANAQKAEGTYGKVEIWGGSLTLKGEVTERIDVLPGTTAQLDGTMKWIELHANTTLLLNGDAEQVNVGKNAAATLNGKVHYLVFVGDHATAIVNDHVEQITVYEPFVTITGEGSATYVTVHKEGFVIQITYDQLNNIWYDTYGKAYESALDTVETMRVACDVTRDTFLCKNRNLTNYMCRLPKGAVVYNEYHPTGDVVYISYIDENGKYWEGWTDRWSCYIPDDTITTDGKLDYSKATKEGFVDLMGYDSKTEYLVWLSRYTQKVMVFQGSKGNWELIKTFPCSSGENNTPTPAGTFEINSRTGRWNYDDYYVGYVSIFNGGHAFHTVLTNYDGTMHDGRVGIPLSHGCVRMLHEDCRYIYNLPMYTRVVVY